MKTYNFLNTPEIPPKIKLPRMKNFSTNGSFNTPELGNYPKSGSTVNKVIILPLSHYHTSKRGYKIKDKGENADCFENKLSFFSHIFQCHFNDGVNFGYRLFMTTFWGMQLVQNLTTQIDFF